MSRAIVTGAVGDKWGEISRITWPRMQRYSQSIGVPWHGFTAGWSIRRPPAWEKLIWIADALATFEEVLWVDADVFVCDGAMQVSIFDGIPDSCDQAMAIHENPKHFNTGVWMLRRAMLPVLVAAAMEDECVHHAWWEQAAIHRVMARNSTRTHALDIKWNCPKLFCTNETLFRHACGEPEQLQTLRDWSS